LDKDGGEEQQVIWAAPRLIANGVVIDSGKATFNEEAK
jgi:hypothetical protein